MLMTGLRPETTGIMDLPTHFRDVRPEAVTIAQHFKQHGYFTQRVGKIFHTGHGNRDDSLSWSIPARIKLAPRYGPEATQQLRKLMGQAKAQGLDVTSNKTRPRGLPWEAPEVADNELTDGSIAENAIKLLREHQDQPFFLAVGFFEPSPSLRRSAKVLESVRSRRDRVARQQHSAGSLSLICMDILGRNAKVSRYPSQRPSD